LVSHCGELDSRFSATTYCGSAGVRIELLFEQILGLELGVGVVQANLDAVGVEEGAVAVRFRRP
jgi:hypothetical protein